MLRAHTLKHRLRSRDLVQIHVFERPSGSEAANWKKLAGSGATLVVYMPGRDYSGIATNLKHAGLRPNTPCAIVSRAATSNQQAYRTTIGELAIAPALPAPSLLVVGEVVRFAAADVFQNLEFPMQRDRESVVHLSSSVAQEPVE